MLWDSVAPFIVESKFQGEYMGGKYLPVGTFSQKEQPRVKKHESVMKHCVKHTFK